MFFKGSSIVGFASIFSTVPLGPDQLLLRGCTTQEHAVGPR